MVGRVGIEPTQPQGNGVMVLYPRIELGICKFEILDCFLLALFLKLIVYL